MFSRHLIAAAALMAATCAAHADAITTTTTVSSTSTIASDLSIVDTSTALSGANTGLASVLAAPNTSSQLVLVRGVEGLYMLASRATVQAAAATGSANSVASGNTAASTTASATDAATGSATGSPSGAIALTDADPVTNIDLPVVNAADVPEPATLALMLAGVLGAISFTRVRKQG
jgi:hypothetical protein